MRVLKQDKELGISLRAHDDGRWSVRVVRPLTGAVIEERKFTSFRSASNYYTQAISSAKSNPLNSRFSTRRWYR